MGLLKVLFIIFIIAQAGVAGLGALTQQDIWTPVVDYVTILIGMGADSTFLINKAGQVDSILSIGTIPAPSYGAAAVWLTQILPIVFVVICIVYILSVGGNRDD